MHVESRDSVSLKPAELDELSQLLSLIGISLGDCELDQQLEQFPLVVQATVDGDRHGFLFGSLERVGGTPCILWGLGAIRRSRNSNAVMKGLVGELYRRAAISFPDEDVLVAGQVAHAAAYGLLAPLTDVVPRVGYSPTGEERAWGRRLARRFSCDSRYDDRTFRCGPIGKSAAILDASTVKAGGKAAATLLEGVDALRGEALVVFGWALADALADGLSSGV
jgi:hypothetical protein